MQCEIVYFAVGRQEEGALQIRKEQACACLARTNVEGQQYEQNRIGDGEEGATSETRTG
jgi:hypothetical protein